MSERTCGTFTRPHEFYYANSFRMVPSDHCAHCGVRREEAMPGPYLILPPLPPGGVRWDVRYYDPTDGTKHKAEEEEPKATVPDRRDDRLTRDEVFKQCEAMIARFREEQRERAAECASRGESVLADHYSLRHDATCRILAAVRSLHEKDQREWHEDRLNP